MVGAVNNYANLLQVSNAISIWLGISPPDLFFYAVSAGQPALHAGLGTARFTAVRAGKRGAAMRAAGRR